MTLSCSTRKSDNSNLQLNVTLLIIGYLYTLQTNHTSVSMLATCTTHCPCVYDLSYLFKKCAGMWVHAWLSDLRVYVKDHSSHVQQTTFP